MSVLMAPLVTSESIRRGRVAATLKASRSLNVPAGSWTVLISNGMQVQQPSGNAAGAAEVGHASRSQHKVADLIFYPIRPMAFAESAFVSEQRKETAAEREARRRQSLSGVLTEVSISVRGTIDIGLVTGEYSMSVVPTKLDKQKVLVQFGWYQS